MNFSKSKLIVLIVLGMFPLGVPASPRESSLFLRQGVVVERLSENAEAASAGMRNGDILVSWSRGKERGQIDSPFSLTYLRYEQAARGPIQIVGFSFGRRRSWLLGSDPWGIWGRPNFLPDVLSKYKECERPSKRITTDQIVRCWEGLITEAQRERSTWVKPWLLVQMAQQLASQRQWKASDASFERAFEETFDSDFIVRGALLIQWARSVNNREDLGTAAKYFEEAAQEWARAGNESVAMVAPLLDVGSIAIDQGDYHKADTSLRQALMIGEKFAPHGLETILAYANLAVLYQHKGELARAEEYYRLAITSERKYLTGIKYLPRQLTNLGTLARIRGDLVAAETYHFEALGLAKRFRDDYVRADILDNLSDCFADRNDLTKAEYYQKRAFAVRKQLIPGSLDMASSLTSLGVIAERKGNLNEAEKFYQEALALDSRLAPQSPAVAEILSGLGSVSLRRGDPARAEEYFRDALGLLDKTAPESLIHGVTMASLASAMRQKRKLDAAAQLYRQALRELESKAAQLTPFDEVRSRYRAKQATFYREYIDLLNEQGLEELSFETVESSRARSLFEMLFNSHVDVRRGADPLLLAREVDLRRSLNSKLRYRLRLLDANHTEAELDAVEREITVLRRSYQELETQLRITSPAYTSLSQPQPLSTKDIQQLLDNESVLLEYALGEKHTYLWVVTQDSLKVYSLPKRSEVERLARRAYGLLTSRNRIILGVTEREMETLWRRADKEYPQVAAELSQMALGPVSSLIAGKRLLIVSDGALQYIPFAALPEPTANQPGKPLILDHEIVNLPSASVLAELRRQAATRASPPKTVAVLADPVFDAQDRRVSNYTVIAKVSALRGTRSTDSSLKRLTRSAADVSSRTAARNGEFHLERLLYTRKEADAILAVTPPGTAMKAVDFQASRATALSPTLAQYRIVHFATHGMLDSKHPELSGLVLSLVNKEGKPQDGFLELQDIYNMNLPVDLVVLSGCKTGLGEEINGEGIVGLTRGFMYAGATRVVASLWGVGDWATAELMERFYRAMEQEHMRPAAALRAAQIQMWKQASWKSPYYWAAFQIQGEWK